MQTRTIVIAGASGFLGRHLSRQLTARGHEVVALTRRPASPPGESQWDPASGRVDRDLIERADVVVNLAGSPTLGNPHSSRWARALRESRVRTTRVLAEAVAGTSRGPALLAGNAVGWYGDHGADPITEESASRGDSFMTQVCREWQDAAQPAVDAGGRVCFLRTAPVLDVANPPLKQLRLATRLGLGARLGDGRQRMAMVSLRDWVGGVTRLVEHDDINGPVNLCSAQTPTNAEFTRELGRALGRPTFLAVPAPLIRLAAGRISDEALGSLDTRPTVLQQAGYEHRDPTVVEVVRTGLGGRGLS